MTMFRISDIIWTHASTNEQQAFGDYNPVEPRKAKITEIIYSLSSGPTIYTALCDENEQIDDYSPQLTLRPSEAFKTETEAWESWAKAVERLVETKKWEIEELIKQLIQKFPNRLNQQENK